MELTVTQLAIAYGGSNPSLPTTESKMQCILLFLCLYFKNIISCCEYLRCLQYYVFVLFFTAIYKLFTTFTLIYKNNRILGTQEN